MALPWGYVAVGNAQEAGAKAVETWEPWIGMSDPRITVLGRCDMRDPTQVRLGYPGTAVQFRFTGNAAGAHIVSDTGTAAVDTIVDGGEPQLHLLHRGLNDVTMAAGLEDGTHSAKIVKRTETWQGGLAITGIRLSRDGSLIAPAPLQVRKLMFIGDSVTCGAGVDRGPKCKESASQTSNGDEAYGMLLGGALDAQVQLVCYGGRGLLRDYRGRRDVLNAPQFFDLAIPADETADRVEWKDSRWVPQAVIVSLGTNDFSLEKTDPIGEEKFVKTYVDFVHVLRGRYSDAFIFLTEGAIVTDPRLRQYVQETVTRVNDPRVRWAEARHYPGNSCDGHPTRSQHRRIAQDLEPVLRGALGW